MWARPAGWVVRVGPGKDDRAGFSGPGQPGGRRGWVHIKGEDPWQLARPLPARPSWASLSLFDVCVGGVEHGAHRLPGVRGAVWLPRWGRAQAGGPALEGRQGRLWGPSGPHAWPSLCSHHSQSSWGLAQPLPAAPAWTLRGAHVVCPPAALLAAGPVPGAGGPGRSQLLHHRAHHHRRPLHQEHAHAHAVRLLLCHPAGQVRALPEARAP